MEINKYSLKKKRQDLQKALDAFAELQGLKHVPLGTIRFTADGFRVKIEFKTKEAMKENLVRKLVPNQEIKIGQRFRQKRTEYTVTGTGNAGKFSINVITQTGKIYKIKPESLLRMEFVG